MEDELLDTLILGVFYKTYVKIFRRQNFIKVVERADKYSGQPTKKPGRA